MLPEQLSITVMQGARFACYWLQPFTEKVSMAMARRYQAKRCRYHVLLMS
ncbi:hypothetical protein Y888_10060 [Mixta calida B021323]|nr:hypothetical protein Y888_10060 [Mixta calida B021323]